EYNTGVSCGFYCDSSDTCLARYAKKMPDHAIYKIVEAPGAYCYSSKRHPEELIDMFNLTLRYLCPKLQSIGIEEALLKRRDSVISQMIEIDSYIISTARWLREELQLIECELERKRAQILEYASDEKEQNEDVTPIQIDESDGSDLYYYKSDLRFELTNRWFDRRNNTNNSIIKVIETSFSWLIDAIVMKEIDSAVKDYFKNTNEYYLNITSSITELAGAGSLNSILRNCICKH
ncbi:MAG: hypothetical protein ACRCYJ_07785, partial [Plesiomonas shigelloides]